MPILCKWSTVCFSAHTVPSCYYLNWAGLQPDSETELEVQRLFGLDYNMGCFKYCSNSARDLNIPFFRTMCSCGMNISHPTYGKPNKHSMSSFLVTALWWQIRENSDSSQGRHFIWWILYVIGSWSYVFLSGKTHCCLKSPHVTRMIIAIATVCVGMCFCHILSNQRKKSAIKSEIDCEAARSHHLRYLSWRNFWKDRKPAQ